MKYKKCPHCELNLIPETQDICDVCKGKQNTYSKHNSIQRTDNKPYYFMVFQGENYANERAGGYIWAPKCSKERYVHHWERLTDLKVNDKIFHVDHRKIVAVSDVLAEAVLKPQPQNTSGYNDTIGYYVKCKYIDLTNPLDLDDFREELIKASQDLYSPFNKNGDGNQGYLFPLSRNLAQIFESKIKDSIMFNKSYSIKKNL